MHLWAVVYLCEVVTLVPAKSNIFSILWINVPSEGLEMKLLLNQAKVLACYHMADHKRRLLFNEYKVHRDKSLKGKSLDTSDYVQALQPQSHFNIRINHPHHHDGPLCPVKGNGG